MKTLEQQAILALHSARSLLVKQQTMLVNAMRGLATEFGLTVPKGINRLGELTALVDADEAFPETARGVFTELHDQSDSLSEVSIRSRPKLSRTRGAMKPRAVWRQSPASVRSPPH
jgi:transposase